MDALDLIRARVRWCEGEGVAVLCCPEAVLGGLADDSPHPAQFAIGAEAGRLENVLAPLPSDTVTTIIGFTQVADGNRLYNAAAILHRGAVVGVYRKVHPAISRSVYEPGREVPVFRVGALTLGTVICNDSNHAGLARLMAVQGATMLFVPTNNGLPPARASAELVAWSRKVDIATAIENRMWVVRADVAGRTDALISYGSSGIVDPDGRVVMSARPLSEDLLVAEIDGVGTSRADAADADGGMP
jgi:predicted amidohydrolase